MKRKTLFDAYQWIAFLVIYPSSLIIWYCILGDWVNVVLISVLPVLVAYVIPGLGTNVTRLWEFNTKGKLGKFRWYHGFVLGASINLFGSTMYILSPTYQGIFSAALFGIVLGSFIAFWNWYYDILAIKSGFIILHNKPAAEGKSAEEIAMGYAPVYFFMLGAIYGVYIKLLQLHFSSPLPFFKITFSFMHILALVLPTAVYALISQKTTGDWGIAKYEEGGTEKY
jgi:hypothetical protein